MNRHKSWLDFWKNQMFLGSISIVIFRRNWKKSSKDDSTYGDLGIISWKLHVFCYFFNTFTKMPKSVTISHWSCYVALWCHQRFFPEICVITFQHYKHIFHIAQWQSSRFLSVWSQVLAPSWVLRFFLKNWIMFFMIFQKLATFSNFWQFPRVCTSQPNIFYWWLFMT